MVKTLDINSTYEPAKRSYKWLKVKKDYINKDGIGDSLDLVIIGAKYGTGKRTGVYGGFLVSTYDEDFDTFESCCWVGTGFTDDMLKFLHGETKDRILAEKPENYLLGKSAFPDVFLEARLVVEIKISDI